MNIKDLFKNLDDSTKKLIKTFSIIIIVFILLLIIIGVSKLIFGTKVSNNKLENIISLAGQKYFAKNDKLPKQDGEVNKVSTETLISEKFMRTMDKYTKDTSCSGEVTVTNNNNLYLYNTTLKCSDYKTKTLGDEIISKLVSSGDGVYVSNNEYYYRGENVNNYINIAGTTYLILGIDSSNNVKIIDPKIEKQRYVWDDRYNEEKAQDGLGINIYEKSRLREHLNSVYASYVDDLKKYIVKYNWCVGKRNSANVDFGNVECNTSLPDYVGAIIPTEYTRVSLDPECTNLLSGSCKNYNYLSKKFSSNIWTISACDDNSYEAYVIDSGIVAHSKTLKQYYTINSFNISGNNIVVSGDGSESNPYTIK